MGGRSDNVAVIWHPGEGRRARVVRQMSLIPGAGVSDPAGHGSSQDFFGSGITRANEQQLTGRPVKIPAADC